MQIKIFHVERLLMQKDVKNCSKLEIHVPLNYELNSSVYLIDAFSHSDKALQFSCT